MIFGGVVSQYQQGVEASPKIDRDHLPGGRTVISADIVRDLSWVELSDSLTINTPLEAQLWH